MVKEKEMMCQEALANVLNSEFSHGMFSIGYDDDAVCLEKIITAGKYISVIVV